MTDTGPTQARQATTALTWDVTYGDGTSHRVTTYPGDFVRARRQYGELSKLEVEDGAEVMFYIAWLASRHDPTGLARPDFDAFLDDAQVVEIVTGEGAAAVPTVAAPGNGSRSSSQLPPVLPQPAGSTPTLTPS